jgi:DNA-binding CsgD family transcriptional regulator
MDTVALALLLATWAATSEGVSIALEALAVLRILSDGRGADDLLAIPLIENSDLHRSMAASTGQRAPDIGQNEDELLQTGRALAMLGGLELALGNLERARSAEDEARSMFHGAGDRRSEGLSLWYLALIAAAGHKQREAAWAYRESMLTLIDAGDPPLVYKPLLGLALIAAENGQSEIAAKLLGSAEAQWPRSVDRLLPLDLAAERRAETLSKHLLGNAGFIASRQRGKSLDAAAWVRIADEIVAAANERGAPVAKASACNGKVLTSREQEVLRLMAEGQSNPEIADALCVGVGTAKTHVAHILAKLGVSTRAAAASLAVRQQLI